MHQFYNKFLEWLTSIGPKIIIGIVIFLIGEAIIKFVKNRIRSHMVKKNISSSIRPFLQSLIFAALHVFLVLAIMQLIGLRLTIFAAILAAFGAAAGLALSGTLQNFVSGIIILLLKPFSLRDNIVAQNMEGTVTSIQLFYTVLTTYDNRSVILPNNKLSNEVIINITRQGERRLDIEMKLAYGSDFEKIKNLIMESLNDSDMPENSGLRIGIISLEPDGYKCSVNVWVKAHGFQDTKFQINERILKTFKEGGIKLPGM
jgi:small conductance mechanosensitive channel